MKSAYSRFSKAFCLLAILSIALFCPSSSSAGEQVQQGHHRYDFNAFDTLRQTHPEMWSIIAEGTSESEARARYEKLMHEHPEYLASVLNILTALDQVDLSGTSALTFVKALSWDSDDVGGGSGRKHPLDRDHFFGWVDARMVGAVEQEPDMFHREHGLWMFHRGATSSFKQSQFSRANLHVSFYEHQTRVIDGVHCVKAQIHIDLYRNLAHTFREVIPHMVMHSRTNPRTAYKLRAEAGLKEARHEFAPPYTIVRDVSRDR